MQVALIVLALVACAVAVPSGYENKGYGKSYGQGYNYAPANYKFDYVVKDDYYYLNYGQNEERYGDNTKGYYFNYLPKGSHQTVNYVVDGTKSYPSYAPEYSSDYKQGPKAYSPVYGKVEYPNKNSYSGTVY